MSNRQQSAILAVTALVAIAVITSSNHVRASVAYPYQGTQNFHADGVVTMVDADRDRVSITADDGHQYNLDTDDTQIKLRDTSRPGDTGDLANGMHVEVTGRLLSKDIVAVDHLTVLAYNGPPVHQAPIDRDGPAPAPAPSRPVGPVDAHPAPPATIDADVDQGGQKIRLRGTVENVDDQNGVVVVRVNTHLRTVLVDHDTDLTDIPSPDDDHMGLHPGDRVTVAGRLLGDGSVKAGAVSFSKNIQQAASTAGPIAPPTDEESPHQLVGRISHPSDRMLSRDIKIRVDGGREVTIHVPHDARIQRDGHVISVHELTGDDVIRAIGSYEDDGFKANRIDVLQQYQDDND